MKFKAVLEEKMAEQGKILAKAETEGRGITKSEEDRFNALQGEIEEIHNAIDRDAKFKDSVKNLEKKAYSEIENRKPGDMRSTSEYRKAWINATRGLETEKDTELLKRVNATHGDGLNIIPTTIVKEIFVLMQEKHPILSDVRVMDVKGNLATNLFVDVDENDADVLPDGGEAQPETNIYTNLTVTGFLYIKTVDIPYTLKAMAIDEYSDFLVNELASRISRKIAYDMFYADGEERITGSIAYIEENEADNIIPYTTLKYTDITGLMAATSGVDGVRYIYVNEETYWKELANILDKNGRPIFISDAATGVIRSTLGVEVKLESVVKTGDIIAAKPGWYLLNYNKDITVETQKAPKRGKFEVTGHAIVDGAPISGKAFACLRKTGA